MLRPPRLRNLFLLEMQMFGHPGFPAFQGAAHQAGNAYRSAPQPGPRQGVMDHSDLKAWSAHHAALDDISNRHAGTVNPGFFSAYTAQVAQNSPLRFIRSTVDYSGALLGPVLATQALGNVHRVLTPQGYPTGMVLVVNPSNRFNPIPQEIERLAALAEQGIAVPEIVSYGHFRGHAALIMRENAPLYAARHPSLQWGMRGY